jgi:hypothetical protein
MRRSLSAMPIQLPQRVGRAPGISVGPPPEQLTQPAPARWQRLLGERLSALRGVSVADSYTCPRGSSGYHLAPWLAHGPAEAFFEGTEFAHVHPVYDGSIHTKLPTAEAKDACRSGWAVNAPPPGSLLLFGPRNEEETEVVWLLLLSGYHFACGPSEGR